MQKPDICEECGSDKLTLRQIGVTAMLAGTFDPDGKLVRDMPPVQLDLDVAAWQCEECEHSMPDEEAIKTAIKAETNKQIRRRIAELN